ncbi:DNA-processing protein DprA [Streptomyces bobili]
MFACSRPSRTCPAPSPATSKSVSPKKASPSAGPTHGNPPHVGPHDTEVDGRHSDPLRVHRLGRHRPQRDRVTRRRNGRPRPWTHHRNQGQRDPTERRRPRSQPARAHRLHRCGNSRPGRCRPRHPIPVPQPPVQAAPRTGHQATGQPARLVGPTAVIRLVRARRIDSRRRLSPSRQQPTFPPLHPSPSPTGCGTGSPAGAAPCPKGRHVRPCRPRRARRPLHARPSRRRPRPALPRRRVGAACPPRQHRPPVPAPAGDRALHRRADLPLPHPHRRAVALRPGRPRPRLPAGPVGPRSPPPARTDHEHRRRDRQPRTQPGSRRALHLFATAVAEAGHTVAASLAYGVDATAHAGAHLMGRPTLAVLPRGLDQAYPHNHGPLLNAITENGGAALSLYRPGTVTSGATLQASAALLAALSRAVILIEALDHAQALRTAEAAIDLKRTLLAVPSHSGVRSGGNTRLLTEHLARPCPSPARALELL